MARQSSQKAAILAQIARTGSLNRTPMHESPVLQRLSDLADRVRFYLLNPTPVGFVLAATTVEQVTGKRLPIDKWLA
jgi:hypothetical protein